LDKISIPVKIEINRKGEQVMKIQDEQCAPISAASQLLNSGEIEKLLKLIEGWDEIEESGEKRLRRSFKFKNFIEAMAFTNRIAEIANQQDHHPAILTEYGKVTVTWWTHKIKGLHRNDFIMAAKTSALM
jgi:4a-hydroxytetrahydrobiopterin dehydratase